MIQDTSGRVRTAVAGLAPGYFALVMATGILSVGLELTGHTSLSTVLLVIAVVASGVLGVLTIWRLVAYRARMVQDLHDPSRAFGFGTVVAAANVLGARFALDHATTTTALLLAASGVLWAVLAYVIPWTAVLARPVRPVLPEAGGSWFVWVVATESVAVAAATLQPTVVDGRDQLALLAVVAWSAGMLGYAAVAGAVVVRLLVHPFRPEDLSPSSWVGMGALAITVLAGARIASMADAPAVEATQQLVGALSLVLWGAATALVPALLAAAWWAHVKHGRRPGYVASLWSLVFPLGMYGVAAMSLGTTDALATVWRIGSTELWVALAVWAAVLLAMVVHVVRTVVAPRPRTAPA